MQLGHNCRLNRPRPYVFFAFVAYARAYTVSLRHNVAPQHGYLSKP